MALVAPSMLSANFLCLEKDVAMVNRHADIFHLDVMDGMFVPNISFGFPVIEAISKAAQKPLDVHLMIREPERYVERFAKCGASMLSFHVNSTSSPEAVLTQIRSLGVKAGIALNPDIPLEDIYPYLKNCDYVVLMAVYAGFGGQSFIEDTYARLTALKSEVARQGADCKVEIDGGVSPANAPKLKELGADILVAGSAVFRAENPEAVINQLK